MGHGTTELFLKEIDYHEKKIKEAHLGLLLLYIDACVEYYYQDSSIMLDGEYDNLAKVVEERYMYLPLWFKKLVKKKEFAGGGYVVGFNFGSGKWKVPKND